VDIWQNPHMDFGIASRVVNVLPVTQKENDGKILWLSFN